MLGKETDLKFKNNELSGGLSFLEATKNND